MRRPHRPSSLRRRLTLGILLPVVALIAFNSWSLYQQALRAADTAYDRTLLASAKSIGELLEVTSDGSRAQLRATVLYSALEPFEADNRSRIFYRVSGFDGEMVSGFEDLPAWHGKLPAKSPYAALVSFYDDHYRGEPIRVAVLLQPVAGIAGQGMATIQVAETLELRHTLAQQILTETLWRQALLVLVIVIVVVLVVQRATLPVRRLSAQLRERTEGDLSPVDAPDAPREWQPLVDATNQVVARLKALLEHQKRFVRDASHQLKTPLAVLKTQVQSARQGDVEPLQALAEIDTTVARATQVANQLLALAKLEQLRHQVEAMPVQDWAEVTRAVALDVAPLIAEQQLDFDIETQAAPIRSHEWALRELTRNLIHNAIHHTPVGGRLHIRLLVDARVAVLTVADSGPGLSAAQQTQLFLPFAAGDPRKGSGLGLAICHEIVQSLAGSIELNNRLDGQEVSGLDARVRLPLAG
ncbi:sensor histidine kinase [Paucibacter sp. XJ19-41]|uniref:sensor histidine kinase n=1 Tax=Paucibacter sp. XJ19-41 TaxID=2927824 RepID=UPI002349201E|nr:sensor histidine kinase [Paucibacter sp. XJ19-41]MDC6167231.1 sensor histidine kinase [Paucibacter sp. XJ19-41]